jgi:hypothetical protein
MSGSSWPSENEVKFSIFFCHNVCYLLTGLLKFVQSSVFLLTILLDPIESFYGIYILLLCS